MPVEEIFLFYEAPKLDLWTNEPSSQRVYVFFTGGKAAGA
jgi:hypothetical protein